MNLTRNLNRGFAALSSVLIALNLIAAATVRADDTVPLKLDLPPAKFVGTPKDLPPGIDVEPLPDKDKPAPQLMVPKDLTNLALGKKVTSSDTNAAASGVVDKLVDGKKESIDENLVTLRKGLQYVQIDLGASDQIFAVVIWHAHESLKVFRSVIVQISNDPTFKDGVTTVFNNDTDNSAGFGAGKNRQYFETNAGKVVDAQGTTGRYVRCYSHGSTDSALNEYTEVEVYGRAAK